MTNGTIDVQKTRVFGHEKYLVRQVPFVIGFLLLGLLVFFLSLNGGDRDKEGMLLGGGFVLACLAYIGRVLYLRFNPRKPVVELSRRGILYRLAKDKSLHIPWYEIQGLGLVDIYRGKAGTLRDVPVVRVSQEFFDANDPIKSWWGTAATWSHHFIPKGDAMQVAFHYDVMSVTSQELWNEIETRWRALSGHPDAARPWQPRVIPPQAWIAGWSPSRNQKRAGLIVLVTIAIPAVFFWHWLATWVRSTDFGPASAAYYLGTLLNGPGVQASAGTGGIAVLRGFDVADIGEIDCDTEIVRDDSRSSLLPAFAQRVVCTAKLKTKSGVWATGVFKIVVETSTSPDWEGKPQEYSAYVSKQLDEQELRAELCRLGHCAD